MNILDIVFPKLCVECGKVGDYICSDCKKSLSMPPQICPYCANPSLGGFAHHGCAKYSKLDRLIVGLTYKGLVQKCLKKIKYKNAWEILSDLYNYAIYPEFQDCVIVPVPMWKLKERERGFNQALILSELILAKYCKNSKLCNTLIRIKKTIPMYGLKKDERQKNIKSAFTYVKSSLVKEDMQKTFLLIDDVWTTGSTLNECAKMLRLLGVSKIWGITLAR